MAKPKLTLDIKQQADAIVARFNAEQLKNKRYAHYATRYKGSNLFLGHESGRKFRPICRLTYTGDMENWGFAIYKYSDEHYDPNEWVFTGAGEVDGTIEGAMRAGLKAYPR